MSAENALVRAWHDSFGDDRISVNGVILGASKEGALYRALSQVGADPDGILNPRKIDRFLARIEGRGGTAGFKFARAGSSARAVLWRLELESRKEGEDRSILVCNKISTKLFGSNQQNHHDLSSDHPGGNEFPLECSNCRHHQSFRGDWLAGICKLKRRAAVAACENHVSLAKERIR